MLITIIAWIVLIANCLVLMINCIGMFTCKITSDRVASFIDIVLNVSVVILALEFIHG